MKPINIMVNGLPGNMAARVVEIAMADPRFALVRRSLTGPQIAQAEWRVNGVAFGLIRPEDRDRVMATVQRDNDPFITVDFTHPTAVNANTAFYCESRLPFVMGTTGGDRKALVDTVASSETAAVIAPNMAKPIVGFQAMMAHAADTFPNLFRGYTLEIRESHQQGKADTSGTAKAMVGYFNRLGVPFAEADIAKERDPEIQHRQWGVPKTHLGGHGWHTYTLRSSDGTVRMDFSHNVNGRDVYVHGTLDAVLYLRGKIDAGEKGRVFTMIDVLMGR